MRRPYDADGSSSSDDADDDTVPKPRRGGSLPVGRHPVGDPDLPPISGEEYLRRVRQEAAVLPTSIRISAVATTATGSPPSKRRRRSPTATDAPANPFSAFSVASGVARPPTIDRAWAERTHADFARLQRAVVDHRARTAPPLPAPGPGGIAWSVSVTDERPESVLPPDLVAIAARLPSGTDEDAWFRFLYAEPTPAHASVARLAFLATFSQHMVHVVLALHRRWIAAAVHAEPVVLVARLRTVYCLLAALDADVPTMDAISMLRDLAKVAQRLVVQRGSSAVVAPQDGSSTSDAEVATAARIVLALIAQAFGQRDLCDMSSDVPPPPSRVPDAP
ncbi:hypothetical protein BC828DRAFT_412366 [Blastocladiella britannica]|nr:hypothetical protein BC828DRAFT_412366 [Blastocladiella britannica]